MCVAPAIHVYLNSADLRHVASVCLVHGMSHLTGTYHMLYIHAFCTYISFFLYAFVHEQALWLLTNLCYIGVRSGMASDGESHETQAVAREVPMQVVRMSRRPPPRFAEKTDLPSSMADAV